MTVIFSKKCELGLQAVLYISSKDPQIRLNANQVADAISAPKEFVAKVLQELTLAGIVGSQKGKNGGFYLGKPAADIKLIEIVRALDGTSVFECCVLGFPGCGTGNPCPVHNKWGPIREKTFKMLNDESLAELLKKTKNKFKD